MTDPHVLNNKSAALLIEGQYDAAITSLQRAVKIVRMAICGDLKPGPLENEQGGCQSSGDHNGDFCKFTSSDDSDFFKQPTWKGGPQHSMFRSPIVLTEQRTSIPMTPVQVQQMSYVTVYNMALAHHLKALDGKPTFLHTRRLMLRRALQLYRNAHCVLLNSTEIELPLLHSLAILCNLGHLYDLLGNDEAAALCYQSLLSTIVYFIDCRQDDGMENEDEIPVDGFFSNVVSLISSIAVAPAA